LYGDATAGMSLATTHMAMLDAISHDRRTDARLRPAHAGQRRWLVVIDDLWARDLV
jgi:hypothetical protein